MDRMGWLWTVVIGLLGMVMSPGVVGAQQATSGDVLEHDMFEEEEVSEATSVVEPAYSQTAQIEPALIEPTMTTTAPPTVATPAATTAVTSAPIAEREAPSAPTSSTSEALGPTDEAAAMEANRERKKKGFFSWLFGGGDDAEAMNRH